MAGKDIVLDILAEDDSGRRIAIEMPLQRFRHWPQRSVYGVAAAWPDNCSLDQALQMHIVELRKAGTLGKLPAPLLAWIACLLHNLADLAPERLWRQGVGDQQPSLNSATDRTAGFSG